MHQKAISIPVFLAVAMALILGLGGLGVAGFFGGSNSAIVQATVKTEQPDDDW
jgi:F0F1-type ATP synthase membrane subunit c/vacuolar-type H+-ATPase subunit K